MFYYRPHAQQKRDKCAAKSSSFRAQSAKCWVYDQKLMRCDRNSTYNLFTHNTLKRSPIHCYSAATYYRHNQWAMIYCTVGRQVLLSHELHGIHFSQCQGCLTSLGGASVTQCLRGCLTRSMYTWSSMLIARLLGSLNTTKDTPQNTIRIV